MLQIYLGTNLNNIVVRVLIGTYDLVGLLFYTGIPVGRYKSKVIIYDWLEERIMYVSYEAVK